MKSLLVFLSLLILIGCSENKQDDIKASNDKTAEKIELKKTIKKSIYTEYNYGLDTSIMIYDKSGNMVEERRKSTATDGYWQKTILSYDDKGNDIEYKFYKNWKKYYNSNNENLDNVSIYKMENKYDTKGNLIEHVSFDDKGLLSFIFYYTYDSTNQISSLTNVDEDGTIGSKSIYENGKIVKEIYYDDKGKPTSTNLYEYDQAGNIIFIKGSWETRYEYDSKGNEIGSSTKYENGETDKSTTFYNDKGEKTHTLRYDNSGKLVSKRTYEYFD